MESEKRPAAVVICGPHWQGAVGMATARVLASLGVHVLVFAPRRELRICGVEETLLTAASNSQSQEDGKVVFSRQIHGFSILLLVFRNP